MDVGGWLLEHWPIAWPIIRWIAVKLPSRMSRLIYSDERLAQDVRIEAMKEEDGNTLLLETIYDISRLVIRLRIDNVSPFKPVIVRRMVGSIGERERALVSFSYEGWAIDPRLQGSASLFIDIPITDNQAKRLRELSPSTITLEATAELICGTREIVKGPFKIITKPHITS